MTDAKRLAAVQRLEQKVRRRLIQGQSVEVIPDIRFIITEYRELRLLAEADLMEMVLNQFIAESLQGSDGGVDDLGEPSALEEPTTPDPSSPDKVMSRKEKKETLQFLHRVK